MTLLNKEKKYKGAVIKMSRRRTYVVERPSKRSFEIFLFTTIYVVIAIILVILWHSFLTMKDALFLLTIPPIIGYGFAWIAKKIEKIEENWYGFHYK